MNDLLAAAGGDELPGETLRVFAGDICQVDAETVWFPFTAVLRAEIGRSGVFGGWEDRRGAVGFFPGSPGATPVSWAVQATGHVFAVQRIFVNALLSRAPRFSEAVLDWSARSRDDALGLAAAHIEQGAMQRVARLICDLAVIHGEDELLLSTQAEIARFTGLQRTTVCAAMVRLRGLSMIRYSRSRISVVNLDALRDAADYPSSGLFNNGPMSPAARLAN